VQDCNLTENNQIQPSHKINSKEILKNLAENSFNINIPEKREDLRKESLEGNKEDSIGISNKFDENKIKLVTVEIQCCLSKVNKGEAIFVTKKDQVFKFPGYYLPNNIIKGNSFKITIEETEKSNQKYEKIRYLQNKHFFK